MNHLVYKMSENNNEKCPLQCPKGQGDVFKLFVLSSQPSKADIQFTIMQQILMFQMLKLSSVLLFNRYSNI